MKTKTKILLSIVAMFILFSSAVKAQSKTSAEIKIKTSAVCDMCKETIEKYVALEKGVKKVNLDVESKIATVKYNPEKTSPEKIRKAISKAGYDADEVTADVTAYTKLDDCCKKGTVCKDKK